MRRNPASSRCCCWSSVRRGRCPRSAPAAADRRSRDAFAASTRSARSTPASPRRSGASRKSATRRPESSALLQQQLKAAGFQVTAGVAGIPTAFVATFGSGKPVIGIVGEFDALPGLSQEAQTAEPSRDRGGHARTRLRTQPARHRRARVGDRREGMAGRLRSRRHAALLRHARGRRRLRQGLHGARRALQGRRRRGVVASGRSQRGESDQLHRQHHRQVPVPRHCGARGGGARPRPLGARRGGGRWTIWST